MSEQALITIFAEPENVEKAAQEICDSFCKNIDSKNYDFSFDIDPSTMKMRVDNDMLELPLSEWDPNTTYQSDTEKGTLLNNIVTMMNGIEEPSKILFAAMQDFLLSIRDILHDKHTDAMKEAVRSRIFKAPDGLPMDIFKIINIEIDRLPDFPYLLSISKLSGENTTSTAGVSAVILEIHSRTGKDINEIIQERKDANDPLFENIDGATLKRYIFEVRVDLFVDYTLEKATLNGAKETSGL